jgi:hypothetical protein
MLPVMRYDQVYDHKWLQASREGGGENRRSHMKTRKVAKRGRPGDVIG